MPKPAIQNSDHSQLPFHYVEKTFNIKWWEINADLFGGDYLRQNLSDLQTQQDHEMDCNGTNSIYNKEMQELETLFE